ncbi:hypothetical protein OIO90_002576 [Microbotryomycetes sp. JL221]|nr:hypothetical protein OIO90_002576 [Microbotryomycetes sp. JL221]
MSRHNPKLGDSLNDNSQNVDTHHSEPDRIKELVRSLDRVVDVLRRECRRRDEFGQLSLRLLDKDIEALNKTAEMIRPRGGGGLRQTHSDSDKPREVGPTRSNGTGDQGHRSTSNMTARQGDERVRVGTEVRDHDSIHQIPASAPNSKDHDERKPSTSRPRHQSRQEPQSSPPHSQTALDPEHLIQLKDLRGERVDPEAESIDGRHQLRSEQRPELYSARNTGLATIRQQPREFEHEFFGNTTRSTDKKDFSRIVTEFSDQNLRGAHALSSSRSHSRKPVTKGIERKQKESVKLQGQQVFKSIAEALMLLPNGKSMVLKLACVSKQTSQICVSVLWHTLNVSNVDECQEMQTYLESHPEQANQIQRIVISPLDASTTSAIVDLSEVVLAVRQVFNACPRVRVIEEDFSAFDWDITRVNSDWIASLSSVSNQHWIQIVSKRCWWELKAVIELLESCRTNLKILRLGGAVMDREWSGPSLLKKKINPLTSLRVLQELEMGQVMHSDTLSCILRLTPQLKVLKLSFQKIGSTDNDTPFDNILDALSHVSQELKWLRLISPRKQGDQSTNTLLETVVQLLPGLEILEFQEDRSDDINVQEQDDDQGEQVVQIASVDLLSNLPMNLRELRGRGIVSFGHRHVEMMVQDARNFVPGLKVLDLQWSRHARAGHMRLDDRDRARIDRLCREQGIQSLLTSGGHVEW